MNNANRAYADLKATGLNKARVVIQLQSKGIRGQHKAVDEAIQHIKLMAGKVGVKYVTNFKVETKRVGDNYLIAFEYEGFYNSQVFTSELWKRLSPYFIIQNI